MSDGFYRAFEERHRGSRELIKARLESYLPFVRPLLEAYPTAAAFDLGCGRGEWVELLAAFGFMPMGVELDSGMLEAALKLGLPVLHGDALQYLHTLPDESQVVVSAFHVVEHIKFDQLLSLVTEALRVLRPGGLLIMETPNPENIVVATCNFYLDPSHQRPIPPSLLAFVADYAGFAKVKTLRLQEDKQLASRDDVGLRDVIVGASPDYAVIAQKDAPNEILAMLSDPFGAVFGLSLDDVVGLWDHRIDRFVTRAHQAENNAQEAERKAEEAERKAEEAERKAEEAERKAEEALSIVYKSLSWRIASSLRVSKRLLNCQIGLPSIAHRLLKKRFANPQFLRKNSSLFLVRHPRLNTVRRQLVSFLAGVERRRKARRLRGQVVPASQKDPQGLDSSEKTTVVLETTNNSTEDGACY